MRRAMVLASLFQSSPCQRATTVRDVQQSVNAALGVSCAAVATPQIDVLTSAPFALSHAPGGPAAVFVNGVLQLSGRDYQISGQSLTFTAPDLGDAATIQAIYWYLP